jgi:NAD(P)H-hydrate repair Nnr-like enzyme with NAD(P)H-hydrate dehydratase domain
MVKAKKRKNGARRKTSIMKRPHRFMKAKSNHRRRRSRNPAFFGSQVSAVKMAEYVGAGLVGVTVNRAITAALPASITSNNIFAILASAGIAIAQWWLGSMLSKDLGSAFGFGGLMNAANTALNTFIPSVGSVVSLGRVGDFVPATFSIPPQPAGIGGLSSYPM